MKSGAMEVLRNIRVANTAVTGTYTEVQCNLALSLESRFLYYVTAVNVSVENPVAAIDAACAIQWQICRAAQTAIVGYDNSDVLWKGGLGSFTTTSGGLLYEVTERQLCNHPYAVAAPTLYFGCLASATAADPNMTVNLEYYPQKVTQQQFWEASQTR